MVFIIDSDANKHRKM